MPNRDGRAGRRGVPATTVAAFLDHYTYTGFNPTITPVDGDPVRCRRINGKRLSPSWQRTIRRYRNGQVKHVSPRSLLALLHNFGFDLAEFHRWARAEGLPIT